MNPIDLQIQTTASDGRHTPRECVEMAKRNGVHTVAITDHDTVAGVEEAATAGLNLGIRVIPGVEISAEEHHIHILGLGIDPTYPPLAAALNDFAEQRIERGRKLVDNLKRAGFAVEWEDVLKEAGSAVITSPHIVEAIMKRPENRERLGGVVTKHDFYREFLSETSGNLVHLAHISASSAIGLIHAAGGVAVWSHPPIPDFVGQCPELSGFFDELSSSGLDGIELFGPFLTESDFACLEDLARRRKVLVTAGSDFHEARAPSTDPWPRSATTVGDYPTYGRSLDGILPALERAIAARGRPVAR